MRYILSVFFAAALFAVGCAESGGQQGTENAGGATGGEKGSDKKNTGYSGNWLVIISRMDAPRESHLAIVEIARKMGGEYVGKVIDSSDDVFPDATLAKTEVDKGGIHLEFAIGERGKLDVRGSLKGDTIYGTAPTNSGLQPLRMIRTKDKTVKGASGAVPTDGAETFEADRKSDDAVDRLQQFARKFNKSPTALSAYLSLLQYSKENKLDEAVVAKIIGNFVKTGRRWGPRMENNVRLDSASILVQQKYLPDLALKTLLPLEKKADEIKDDEFASRLKLTGAMVRLISTDEEIRKAGAASLQEMHEADIPNHRLRVALAKYHDENGDKEVALRLYSELALLPEGDRYLSALGQAAEGKSESAEQASLRLWKAIHGKSEGLEEYRDQIYEKAIEQLFGAPSTLAPANRDGKRMVLCELFTGSACPPCVAADLATVGLEATYPRSSVIVLRYHQHIPQPDPLANAASETRFSYYELEGTPMVILNGKHAQGIAGPFAYSQFMFSDLRKMVDDVIDDDSKLLIQLSATAKEGRLSITATVDGVKDLPKSAKLRLVLAEDSIHFNARNGVQRHEMVVRYMPGGPEGIAVKEGRLSFETSLVLASIKKELIDYLDRYASGIPPQFRQQMPNGPFPMKPMDLKPLHLIAIVQDDQTKEVLQTASIPVGGQLVYPGKEKEQAADTPPSPADDDPNRPVVAPVPGGSTAKKKDETLNVPAPMATEKKEAKSPKGGPKLIPPGKGQ